MVATEPWPGATRPRADAIVTRTEGLAIGVTAADCGPILFVDPNARVIGAAHAGWKGALTGVLESTVDAMEKLGADRGGIVAAIGPLIRQHSYEVGGEFVERFVEADAENALFFIPSDAHGHAMFDLAGFIRMRLENAGVLMIDDIGVDTYSDERFYSYRRSVHRKEPDYGRHVHAIALEAVNSPCCADQAGESDETCRCHTLDEPEAHRATVSRRSMPIDARHYAWLLHRPGRDRRQTLIGKTRATSHISPGSFAAALARAGLISV